MASETLEEFVLSNNRRKLLQIDTENDDSKNFEISPSSIIHGSEEHKYYHLLQIENEITQILINNKDLNNASQDDIDKIKSLLNEANDIISKAVPRDFLKPMDPLGGLRYQT